MCLTQAPSGNSVIMGAVKVVLQIIIVLCYLAVLSLPWYRVFNDSSSALGHVECYIGFQAWYVYEMCDCSMISCSDGFVSWADNSSNQRAVFIVLWCVSLVCFFFTASASSTQVPPKKRFTMLLLSTLLQLGAALSFLALPAAVAADSNGCPADSPCDSFWGSVSFNNNVTGAYSESSWRPTVLWMMLFVISVLQFVWLIMERKAARAQTVSASVAGAARSQVYYVDQRRPQVTIVTAPPQRVETPVVAAAPTGYGAVPQPSATMQQAPFQPSYQQPAYVAPAAYNPAAYEESSPKISSAQ